MIYYLDASALTKVYSYEKGSEVMVALLGSKSSFYSSVVIYPEVLFAMRRKKENREINQAQFSSQVESFEEHFQALVNRIELHRDIMSLLKNKILQYSMKALDAIHLASALWVKEEIDNKCKFVCSDTELIRYSKDMGFEVINPEEV